MTVPTYLVNKNHAVGLDGIAGRVELLGHLVQGLSSLLYAVSGYHPKDLWWHAFEGLPPPGLKCHFGSPSYLAPFWSTFGQWL